MSTGSPRTGGFELPFLNGCVLKGAPIECAVRKTDGLRGPWELITGRTTEYRNDAILTAPFKGGKIVVKDINARGIFGPAPLFGGSIFAVGNGWPAHDEGVDIQSILDGYPRFGHFNVRLSAKLNSFETSSLDLIGIQKFTLDVDAGPHGPQEFFYDGSFVLAVAYQKVRESAPGWFSDSDIRKLQFGVRDMGMSFKLFNGKVYGPSPRLANGLIVRGFGGMGLFTNVIKKDVPGQDDAVADWFDAVRAAKERLK